MTTTHDRPPMTGYPPVRRYVEAVAAGDAASLARAFATDGSLLDVSRRFTGREAIHDWAEAEVIGGRLDVHAEHPRRDGVDLLVRFRPPPGTGAGFLAWYCFDTTPESILAARLSYADGPTDAPPPSRTARVEDPA